MKQRFETSQTLDEEYVLLPFQIALSPPKPLRLFLDCIRTNTLLYTGKLMITYVFDQVLRFHFHRYFCQWDVKSMYFSVQLKDIKYSLLFQLLYKPMNDDQGQLLVYHFRYVVMGSKDASFQTASCIAKIADIIQEELPEVSKLSE